MAMLVAWKILTKYLEVLETIPAGKVAEFEIAEGQCSKIMTGAFIPKGADTVFKIEESEEIDAKHIRCTNPKTKRNICYKGEDYNAGQVLIEKGSIIQASHIAVLAGAGYHKVKVSTLPSIAIITTGSELVEPSEKPPIGKIRNSNSSQLIAQLSKMGLAADYIGLFQDDYSKLTATFQEAISNHDILIFTGGASFGDFDWIPKIFEDQNFNIFWKNTGMKPGNPMTFAQKEDKYVIGLVSSMVQFEYIGKAILYQLFGANYEPIHIKANFQDEYFRKNAERFAVIPVIVNLIPFNGSAHINALVMANAFMEVPENVNEFKKGDKVYVRQL